MELEVDPGAGMGWKEWEPDWIWSVVSPHSCLIETYTPLIPCHHMQVGMQDHDVSLRYEEGMIYDLYTWVVEVMYSRVKDRDVYCRNADHLREVFISMRRMRLVRGSLKNVR